MDNTHRTFEQTIEEETDENLNDFLFFCSDFLYKKITEEISRRRARGTWSLPDEI